MTQTKAAKGRIGSKSVGLPFETSFRGQAPAYTPGGFGFVTQTEVLRYPALQIPEISSGFVNPWWQPDTVLTHISRAEHGAAVQPSQKDGRAFPLRFRADTGPGIFRVELRLFAESDCREALVFVSRRRLVWRRGIKAGETVCVEALCDVSPIYPAGKSDMPDTSSGCVADESVDISVVAMSGTVRLAACAIRPARAPRMFLMGDSTVTDQQADIPYAPGCTYCGWGQMLPAFLGTEYCVSNHAHSGLTTQSFREQGHYRNLRGLIRPGDVVLMQFGHNDQKWRRLSADTGYYENLIRYVEELKALEARPVLVTPLARNTWKSAAEYNDLLCAHARAVQKAAGEGGTPLIDLHGKMMALIRRDGMQASRQWFHPCDYTHTNDFGACLAAGFVAEALRSAGLIHQPPGADWRVYGPMEALAPPEDRVPPQNRKPLVDYGLIPDYPWEIH